jgi:hypothetical protein
MAESHQRQMPRIVFVAAVLQSVVLLHGYRVGQLDPIFRLLQAIDQPVSTECQFHHDPDQLLSMRLQQCQYW